MVDRRRHGALQGLTGLPGPLASGGIVEEEVLSCPQQSSASVPSAPDL